MLRQRALATPTLWASARNARLQMSLLALGRLRGVNLRPTSRLGHSANLPRQRRRDATGRSIGRKHQSVLLHWAGRRRRCSIRTARLPAAQEAGCLPPYTPRRARVRKDAGNCCFKLRCIPPVRSHHQFWWTRLQQACARCVSKKDGELPGRKTRPRLFCNLRCPPGTARRCGGAGLRAKVAQAELTCRRVWLLFPRGWPPFPCLMRAVRADAAPAI